MRMLVFVIIEALISIIIIIAGIRYKAKTTIVIGLILLAVTSLGLWSFYWFLNHLHDKSSPRLDKNSQLARL